MLSFLANKIITGLEIQDGWVKLAQVENLAGTKRLLQLIVRQLPGQEDEVAAEFIKGLLDQFRIKPQRLIYSIPRHTATIRYLKLPSRKESEIKGMVDFQSVRQIPYSKEEIIADYQVIDITAQGYSQVMLAIVHRDVIAKILKLLKLCGLQSDKFVLSSQALSAWYLISAGERKNCNAAPQCLISAGPSWVQIDIIFREKLIFSRGFSFSQFAKENWRNVLADEIKNTFLAYQREKLAPGLDSIVLAGKLADDKELTEILSKSFSLKTRVLPPLNGLARSEQVKSQLALLEPDAFVASVIGAALDAPQASMDLLPAQIKAKKKEILKRRNFAAAALLVIAVFILGSCILFKKIYDKERFLNYVRSEFKKTAPEAARIDRMRMQVKIIKNQLDMEGSILDTLREVYRIVPEDISIGLFTFDEKKLVTLRGVSRTMSDVFKFASILEKSEYFQNVDVKYASNRKLRGQEVADFQIYCSLTKGPE